MNRKEKEKERRGKKKKGYSDSEVLASSYLSPNGDVGLHRCLLKILI